jgi:hypothetical protein
MKSARTRRIPMMTTSATATIEGTKPPDVIVRGNASGFLQEIVSGAHQLRADEPVSVGGGDAAPRPVRLSADRTGGMHIESVIEEGGKSRSAEIGPLNTPASLER